LTLNDKIEDLRERSANPKTIAKPEIIEKPVKHIIPGDYLRLIDAQQWLEIRGGGRVLGSLLRGALGAVRKSSGSIIFFVFLHFYEQIFQL
jgi:hypothetical protein